MARRMAAFCAFGSGGQRLQWVSMTKDALTAEDRPAYDNQ